MPEANKPAEKGTGSYSPSEIMVVRAARELKNGEVVFVGIGLPNLACNLARRLQAPDLVLIYESGAVANIAEFHRAIAEGDFRNPTVAPSVESNLLTILGRKSAYENRVVTWAELLKDGERLIADLKGLKD